MAFDEAGESSMSENAIASVFVVDDDDCIRAAVCAILKRAKYDCCCFADVASCLSELKSQSHHRDEGCDLLITDLKMPEKDGMELLQEARAAFPWIPVIVMTAYGSIPMSVRAVKTGAFDFVEKPVEEGKLLTLVELALLKKADLNDPLVGKPLTRPERIVLCLILEGISNKRIAYILERSERTVEVHRSRIMRKLGVDNVVDLVKKATAMGWTE
jgi:FixJ family two-component response regulator